MNRETTADVLKREWARLDALRKDRRGADGNGTSFWDARREATGYAQHRVFNGGYGAWVGGWGSRKLYDSTVRLALTTAVNGVMSYIITPSQKWFKLRYGNLYDRDTQQQVKIDNVYGLNDHLESVEEEILKLFSATNFYPSVRTFIADAMVQGTAIMLLHDHGDDESEGGLCFRTLDPADVSIDEDDDGHVNVVFRQFDLTINDAYKKWGDALPQRLVDTYKRGDTLQKRVVFIEAVFPCGSLATREGVLIDDEIKKTKEAKYSYMVLCEDGDEVVASGVYDEFPFIVLRWERVSDDTPYGIGTVMRCLPEIKTLNENMKLQLIANQKMVNPPITVPMAMRDFDARPGAVNFGDPSQAPVPLKTVQGYDGFAQENERLRQVIYEGLYANLFITLMRTQNLYRTATEVNELKSEALSLMAATVNNLQYEFIAPVIRQTYRIMAEHNLIPPLPQGYIKLFGSDIQVELDSAMINKMRQYMTQQGIESGLAFVSQVATATQDPTVFYNVDLDEAVRQGATSKGMPQDVLREKADVVRMKEERAKQQQAQQQAQLDESTARSMQAMGNAGVDVAQQYGLAPKESK